MNIITEEMIEEALDSILDSNDPGVESLAKLAFELKRQAVSTEELSDIIRADRERIVSLVQEVNRLEKELTQRDRACLEWAEVSQNNYQRAKTAEAQLEKVFEMVKLVGLRPMSRDPLVLGLETDKQRIAELETNLREAALQSLSDLGQAQEAYASQLEAETKLNKAIKAFEWLEDELREHGYPDQGPMRSRCRSTLTELKRDEYNDLG